MSTTLSSNWVDAGNPSTESTPTSSAEEIRSDELRNDAMTGPPHVNVPKVEEPVQKDPSSMPLMTETTEPARALEHAPTESHALATQDHDEKGFAQLEHDEPEVKDLGWDQKLEHIPAPLVGGLPNEELWVLVRRFNKVCLCEKTTLTVAIVSC
jgi:hypothetical protein